MLRRDHQVAHPVVIRKASLDLDWDVLEAFAAKHPVPCITPRVDSTLLADGDRVVLAGKYLLEILILLLYLHFLLLLVLEVKAVGENLNVRGAEDSVLLAHIDSKLSILVLTKTEHFSVF